MKDAPLQSYPWYVPDWRGSETRISLPSAAKYVFRELLDQCWIEGSIPSDEQAMARIAAVDLKEFRSIWPMLKSKFVEQDGRLTHWRVIEKRPNLLAWAKGRAKGADKANESKRNKRAKAHAIASAINHAECSPSLTLTLPNNPIIPSSDEDTPDLSNAFDELWSAYPAKGRTKRIACENYYAQECGRLTGGELQLRISVIHKAVAPGGIWAVSDKWAKGFVQGLDTYLKQRQWLEAPEPAGKQAYDPHDDIPYYEPRKIVEEAE